MVAEIDRLIPELGGRVRIPYQPVHRQDRRRYLALMDRLQAEHRYDLIDDLWRGRTTWGTLFTAARENRLGQLRADLLLRAPLWETVDRLLADARPTVARYRVSFGKLQRLGVLAERATILDLRAVPWATLARDPAFASGSDWNHLRRAISRLLSLVAHKGHPFWVELRALIPIRPERERVPEVGLDDLQRFMDALPARTRDIPLVLVLTGLRLGEYLRLEPRHLGHYTIQVPQTKPGASDTLLRVAPEAWPTVRQAVPCPVSERTLRRDWDAARHATGLELTRHDCRHLAAQFLADAGRPLTAIQAVLRHKTMTTTARYAKRRLRGEDAEALAAAVRPLFGVQDVLPLRERRGVR